jgi:release factor H-coupled RctB family protein
MKNKTKSDREICCQGDYDISNIVICQDVNLFYEEAPFAYKDIQAVIDDLEHFQLAIPICSFIPVITFKCKK